MKDTTNLNFFEAFEELSRIQEEQEQEQEPILEARWDRQVARQLGKEEKQAEKDSKKILKHANKTFDERTAAWVPAIMDCKWDLGYYNEPAEWYSMYPKSPDYRLPPDGARSNPDITVDDINHRWKYNDETHVSINDLQVQAKQKLASKPKQYQDLDIQIHNLVRTEPKFEDVYWEIKDPEEILNLSEQEAAKVVFEKYRIQGYVLKNFIKEVIKLCQ